ncbi:hypothetical protein ACGFYA_05215 [Streptomyces sp. NPDC048305]|uniref:hypothetical protein n=1 Tax=Streptomyces sp. NPDC048305 TaxID=3365532 RepID=UPI00371BBC5C
MRYGHVAPPRSGIAVGAAAACLRLLEAPNEDSATPTTIDATPLIWNFLTRHPLPAR